MGLATISSQYLNYNGLCGYGYGYGCAAVPFGNALQQGGYVDAAKQNIANMYEINSTSAAYNGKTNASAASFNQQCQSMQYLFKEGRTDDAMNVYRELYREMSSNSNYQGYSENEIKTKLQEQYASATGSTIVNDAKSYGGSSYLNSLVSSIPIFGAAGQCNSTDDVISTATSIKPSKLTWVKKGLGVATGAAISGGIGFGIGKLLTRNAASSTSRLTQSLGKWGGRIGAAIGIIASVATYFIGKATKNDNNLD